MHSDSKGSSYSPLSNPSTGCAPTLIASFRRYAETRPYAVGLGPTDTDDSVLSQNAEPAVLLPPSIQLSFINGTGSLLSAPSAADSTARFPGEHMQDTAARTTASAILGFFLQARIDPRYVSHSSITSIGPPSSSRKSRTAPTLKRLVVTMSSREADELTRTLLKAKGVSFTTYTEPMPTLRLTLADGCTLGHLQDILHTMGILDKVVLPEQQRPSSRIVVRVPKSLTGHFKQPDILDLLRNPNTGVYIKTFSKQPYCSKCAGPHKASDCSKPLACLQCGADGHHYKDCQSSIQLQCQITN